MVETYKQKGAEGIFDFYTRVMDVNEQELMNNPDLFADFTKVVKAENTQLASELVTSHRSLRTMMTDAGFPTGGAGLADPIDSSLVEEPASQITDQLISGDEIAGSEEIGFEDFIETLLASGLV